MPNTLELPWMLRAVVPLMRARDSVVDEFVTLGLRHTIGALQFFGAASGRAPFFAAVVRALNDLAEPSAGLRRVNAVWISRRSFHVINFPACKMGTADFPSSARAVSCQDERSFSCAD